MLNKLKRKDLLKLPNRGWNEESTYESILIIPSGKKHDSGYALMAIIGCKTHQEPTEIAAYCDDINWKIPDSDERYGPAGIYTLPRLRTDMGYPNGIVHMWGNHIQFKVGRSLSSTDVEIVNKEKKQ